MHVVEFPNHSSGSGRVTEWIRISEGTGTILGLWDRKLGCPPSTGYLMTYRKEGCTANCAFCPQARSSESSADRLSRVNWPKVEFEEFASAFRTADHSLRRICIQALNYPGILEDLIELTVSLRDFTDIPLSISCQPLDKDGMIDLREAGVDRLGIPLDASTERVFKRIKGRSVGSPYRWEKHQNSLKEASEVFDGNVSTHLLVGLGESEEEIISRIQSLHDAEITVALFAFTPVKGTKLEGLSRPDLDVYRRVQIARHLIDEEMISFDDMKFEGGKVEDFGIDDNDLIGEISSGKPFETSGCPGCNRPFYNESPGGPIYNYPEPPSDEEVEGILERLNVRGELLDT